MKFSKGNKPYCHRSWFIFKHMTYFEPNFNDLDMSDSWFKYLHSWKYMRSHTFFRSAWFSYSKCFYLRGVLGCYVKRKGVEIFVLLFFFKYPTYDSYLCEITEKIHFNGCTISLLLLSRLMISSSNMFFYLTRMMKKVNWESRFYCLPKRNWISYFHTRMSKHGIASSVEVFISMNSTIMMTIADL